MRLSRTPKILVGIGTAIVALLPIILISFAFLPMFLLANSRSGELDMGFMATFFIIFPVIMLLSFLQLGLMGFYIIAIVKNKSAADVVLIILALGLYFLPYVAMPAYYLIYIWPEQPPEWAMAAGDG